MNNNKVPVAVTSQSQDNASVMEDGDDFNLMTASCSTENILEHFPYLRNDGLGQFLKEQKVLTTPIGVGMIKSDNADDEIKVDSGHKADGEIKADLGHKADGEIKADPDELQQTSSENVELASTPVEASKHSSSSTTSPRMNAGIKHKSPESEEDNAGTSKELDENVADVKPKVMFLLKGKLGHYMDNIIKSVREILIEPVDVEEKFHQDYVYNYPRKIKTEPVDEDVMETSTAQLDSSISYKTSQKETFKSSSINKTIAASDTSVNSVKRRNCPSTNTTVTVSSSFSIPSHLRRDKGEKQEVRYTEPSIAEIRASVLGSSDPIKTSSEFEYGVCKIEKNTPDDILETAKEEIFNSDSDDLESEIKDIELNDNIFKAAITHNNRKSVGSSNSGLMPKKGGRSDPENPFALTSPSFSDSTAKALMTTTQTSTATIVMISIMSIGSRENLIPKIVNSKAAEGGLVSIINPIEPPGTKSTQVLNGEQISSERTSIMSKVRQEKSKLSEMNGSKNSNIDRLDVNVKIDDDQYVGHGENKRWLCKICPKSYTTKHNLVSHILDHSDVKPHLCLLCEKYFKQLSHLNTHMLTHDNVKPYICTQCDKGFTQISHLKRHETVHMGSKPYICDICSRGFAYPSELRLHKEKHVSGGEKCTDCDKEFPSWNELSKHMAESNHCSDLKCKQCDRIFRFPSLLRDHMMSHAGSRPFICTECGMDFMKEHHLKSHLFTHTGIRPYACPECGRAFNQKANMQRHMLIHNAERAYMCDICNKTFTQPQTLKAHMVVHSDSKPYTCDICGKQFGRQHNLQGHMHIHSDTKPYSCSICQAAFTMKGNLNRHKKVKHGLDESTEVMEEDAVNFLSSIFDRARENYLSPSNDDDVDQESKGDLSSPESRSGRKGRKSMPRKHVSKKLPTENSEDASSDVDVDSEQMITYSDEERENERTREFNSNNSERSERSRRKRKRDMVYRYDDDYEEEGDFNEKDSTDVKDDTDDMNETKSIRKRHKRSQEEESESHHGNKRKKISN